MPSDIELCIYKIFTHNRVDVFSSEEIYNLLFDAISFLKKKYKIEIYAYLLMPNQVHLVTDLSLEDIETDFTDNFKKITRNNAIQVLEKLGENNTLDELEIARGKKKYRLWEVKADIEKIEGLEKLTKKIELLHNKPVQTEIVEDAAEYNYSSAKFYIIGKPTEIKILDYRNLFDE